MAVRNRLALFEVFRLKRRCQLDKQALRQRAMPYAPDPDKFIRIEGQTTILSGVPLHSTPADRTITIAIPFQQLVEKLALAEREAKVLQLLLANRYDNLTDTVTMKCQRFPFQEQNKKWIADRLREVIKYAREHAADELFQDMPKDLFYQKVPIEPKFTFKQLMGVDSDAYLNKRGGV